MSYQINIRQWHYFLAVAEELHFRKAAERLFISQPALTKQVQHLEKTLGYRLFDRHNRKVSLTAAGRYLQPTITLLLHGLDQEITHARLIDQGLQGRLQFGYVGSAMQEIIPDLMLLFRAHYPDVRFSLKEMDNHDQLRALEFNEMDLGFVRLNRVSKQFELYPLMTECFCLVLPTNDRFKFFDSQDLASLKHEDFILFDPAYSPSYYEQVMQIFDDAGFMPEVHHRTVHAPSIYKLVEKGFGVSIMPQSLCQQSMPGITFITLEKLRHRTTLSAVWRRESKNDVLPHFLQVMRQSFKSAI